MSVLNKEISEPENLGADLSDPFKTIPLLRSVRKEAQDAFRHEMHYQNFSRGHVLFMHEDEAKWVYFVQSGWVKLFRETLDGHEAVLDVLPPGSVFAETTIFENGTHASSAEVIEDARILSFPITLIGKESRENPAFALALLRYVSTKVLRRDKEIELRSVQNAAQRIGCFLLRLCKDEQRGEVAIRLSFEKSLIAARLGMTPETFSRSLARLEKDIGLQVNGANLVIPDFGALVRYTCTSCSNVFPCDN